MALKRFDKENCIKEMKKEIEVLETIDYKLYAYLKIDTLKEAIKIINNNIKELDRELKKKIQQGVLLTHEEVLEVKELTDELIRKKDLEQLDLHQL